jgi:thymidine phosphorylase
VALGQQMAALALTSGRAAEAFARMVAALGGPADVLAQASLPVAPVQLDVPAPRSAVLCGMDTRALGLAVVALGGGRVHASDAVNPAVGLSHVQPLGSALQAGDAVMRVHAASLQAAQAASDQIQQALQWGDVAPAPQDLILEVL